MDATLVDHTETGLQFELQACDASFFETLDSKKAELGIDSYRIKTASLEDLFLEYGKKLKESDSDHAKSSRVEEEAKEVQILGGE